MADELIQTITPGALAELLKVNGYRVTEAEQNGIVQLMSASQGVGFTIRFGNRLPTPADAYVDFTFGCVLQVQGDVPADIVASWNRSRRFARLSLQAQFLLLEMDVTVAGGVSPAHMRAQIELWDRLIQEFLLHLRQGFTAPHAAPSAAPKPDTDAEAVAPVH
jgi:hypothetical protein